MFRLDDTPTNIYYDRDQRQLFRYRDRFMKPIRDGFKYRLGTTAFKLGGLPVEAVSYHAERAGRRRRDMSEYEQDELAEYDEDRLPYLTELTEQILDSNQGEIWAKLEAGTETYYQLIERTPVPFDRVLQNITAAAQVRPPPGSDFSGIAQFSSQTAQKG